VGDKGDQGLTGPQGEPGVSKTLNLKDRFGQVLGIYLGQNVGETTTHYFVYEPTLGANLNFLVPNNHFSDQENSAELIAKSCQTPLYFRELNCTGAMEIVFEDTCWEANTITKMGERYFQKRSWASRSHDASVRSSLDSTGACTNYEEGSGLRVSSTFGGANEVVLPFTFPIRLPLKIVSE
jgi:hypothetical protein